MCSIGCGLSFVHYIILGALSSFKEDDNQLSTLKLDSKSNSMYFAITEPVWRKDDATCLVRSKWFIIKHKDKLANNLYF